MSRDIISTGININLICFPSCAGLFIHAPLGFDWTGVWMHVDMAAPSAVSFVADDGHP